MASRQTIGCNDFARISTSYSTAFVYRSKGGINQRVRLDAFEIVRCLLCSFQLICVAGHNMFPLTEWDNLRCDVGGGSTDQPLGVCSLLAREGAFEATQTLNRVADGRTRGGRVWKNHAGISGASWVHARMWYVPPRKTLRLPPGAGWATLQMGWCVQFCVMAARTFRGRCWYLCNPGIKSKSPYSWPHIHTLLLCELVMYSPLLILTVLLRTVQLQYCTVCANSSGDTLVYVLDWFSIFTLRLIVF